MAFMSLDDNEQWNIHLAAHRATYFLLIPVYWPSSTEHFSDFFLLLLLVCCRSQFHHNFIAISLNFRFWNNLDYANAFWWSQIVLWWIGNVSWKKERNEQQIVFVYINSTAHNLNVMIFLGMVSKNAKYLAQAIRALFNLSTYNTFMWMKRHCCTKTSTAKPHKYMFSFSSLSNGGEVRAQINVFTML